MFAMFMYFFLWKQLKYAAEDMAPKSCFSCEHLYILCYNATKINAVWTSEDKPSVLYSMTVLQCHCNDMTHCPIILCSFTKVHIIIKNNSDQNN